MVLACLWFFPVLTGDQLGQSYTNFAYVPYYASLPESLPSRAVAPDAALTFHPWARVAKEQLRDGELPLWNPYVYGGTTFVGNFQSALFFPFTWVLFLLPLGYAWGVVALLKLVVAGLGGYALARELGCTRRGGLLAGTVYMLSAPVIAWMQWPVSSVAVLLPWLLLATSRVHRHESPAAVSGLALVTGLTILAGHPESALLSFSAATVFLAGLLAFSERRLRTLLLCAGGFALGLALSSVATVPFLEALAASVTQTGFFHVTELPVSRGLAFALPQLFGDGEPTLYGVRYFNEDIAIYFGLPALVLSVAAAKAWLEPRALALGAVGLLALAAMFGVPPISWVFEHVKPWSTTTLGARVGFVSALVGALGAGLGFSALSKRPVSIRAAVAVVAAVTFVFGFGYLLAQHREVLAAPGDVRRDALLTGFLALLACGGLLLAVGRLPQWAAFALATGAVLLSLNGLRDFNAFLPPDVAYPAEPAALQALRGKSGRVGVIPTTAHPTLVPPNVLSTYGLSTAEGYDFPLSRRWSFFQSEMLGFRSLRPEYAHATEPPTRQNLAALRQFNTRYYIAAPGAAAPFDEFDVFYSGPDATVFRDNRALPRAFVVDSVLPTPEAETLEALRRSDFDAHREAVVPEDARIPGAAGRTPRSTQVEQISGDHVRVSLGPGGGGWLVLADAYAPTWKAKVDGDDVDVEPTNYAAMGVPVPRSARTVDFYLDRTSFWVGAAISGVALILIVLLAAWSRLPARVRDRTRPSYRAEHGGSQSG